MPLVPNIPSSDAIAALPGIVNNNTGGLGGDIQSSQVVSTIYDLDPFAIMANVFSRHDQRPTSVFRIMLEMLGMVRGVGAPTTGHYEEDRLENLVKIGSIQTASTGAGTNVVLNLHADMMFTYSPGQTANGSAAQGSSVRPNDILLFDNNIKAIVISKTTTVNPHRITVRPILAAQDLASNITAGSSYAVLTNAHPEGSGLPQGKLPRLTKYTNTFQIVKEAFGGTGTSATDTLFVKWERAGGGDGSIHAILNLQAMDRFERNVSNALLFGSQIDNVTTFNSALGIDIATSGTEGMIDFAKNNGHIPSYSIGAYSLDDYDNISTIMTEEGVGTNNLMQLMGNALFLEVENLFFNYTLQNVAPLLKGYADTAKISAETWQPFEDENFGFYVGFKCVHKGGYNITFKQMPEFVDPTLGNTPAYAFNATAITAPLGQTKDSMTGQPAMKWGYEYRQQSNGFNRRAAFGKFSGIGASDFQDFGPATNENDLFRAGMLAEVAFHGICSNQMIYQEPEA